MSKRNKAVEWWHTSKGILREYPYLKKDPYWTGFAKSFDDKAALQKRLHDEEAATPSFLMSFDLMNLKELANIALNSPDFIASKSDKNLSPEEAGKKLAHAILDLLEIESHCKLEDLFIQAKEIQIATITDTRTSYQLVNALRKFIDRESRLPKKKELNIECNRIANLKKVTIKTGESYDGQHGQEFLIGDQRLIFYSAYRNDEIVINEQTIVDQEIVLYLCPKSEWNKTKRTTQEHSRCLKEAGLSGLGGANTHPNDKRG